MTQWISITINALFVVLFPSEAVYSRGNGKTLVMCYGYQHPSIFSLLMATASKLTAVQWKRDWKMKSLISLSLSHSLTHPDPYSQLEHTQKLPKLPKDCLAGTTIVITELKQLNLLICHWYPQRHQLSGLTLPVPRSRLTALLAKGHTCMHKHSHIYKTRQSRPAGLSSLSDKMQSPLPALELIRKKPLYRCCWV